MIDFPKAMGKPFTLSGSPFGGGWGGLSLNQALNQGGGGSYPGFNWGPSPFGTGSKMPDLSGGEMTMSTMDPFTLQLPDYLEQAFAGIGRGAGAVDLSKFFDTGLLEKAMPEEQMHAAAMQAAEEAGLAGNRWSTALGNKIANQTARAREETMLPLLQMWAQEQARAKAAAAAAASRSLSAAMQRYMLPMQIGGQLMGMAGQYGDTEMGDWMNAYNMWESTTPEWAAGQYGGALQGLLGGYPQGQQMYDQGWAGNLFDIGSALAPFANFASLFGGNILPTAIPAARGFSNLPFADFLQDIPFGEIF